MGPVSKLILSKGVERIMLLVRDLGFCTERKCRWNTLRATADKFSPGSNSTMLGVHTNPAKMGKHDADNRNQNLTLNELARHPEASVTTA